MKETSYCIAIVCMLAVTLNLAQSPPNILNAEPSSPYIAAPAPNIAASGTGQYVVIDTTGDDPGTYILQLDLTASSYSLKTLSTVTLNGGSTPVNPNPPVDPGNGDHSTMVLGIQSEFTALDRNDFETKLKLMQEALIVPDNMVAPPSLHSWISRGYSMAIITEEDAELWKPYMDWYNEESQKATDTTKYLDLIDIAKEVLR
jgi:hypothetical protein